MIFEKRSARRRAQPFCQPGTGQTELQAARGAMTWGSQLRMRGRPTTLKVILDHADDMGRYAR